MLIRLLQPANAISPIVFTLSPNITSDNDLHPLNAEVGITVTPFPITMLLSVSHVLLLHVFLVKSASPNFVTLSGMTKLSKLLQLSNTLFPIVVIFFPIFIDVRLIQLLNALFSIIVTGKSSISSGITTSSADISQSVIVMYSLYL